jgi:hypothetical protein
MSSFGSVAFDSMLSLRSVGRFRSSCSVTGLGRFGGIGVGVLSSTLSVASDVNLGSSLSAVSEAKFCSSLSVQGASVGSSFPFSEKGGGECDCERYWSCHTWERHTWEQFESRSVCEAVRFSFVIGQSSDRR